MRKTNLLARALLVVPLMLAVAACNEQILEVEDEATTIDAAQMGSVDFGGNDGPSSPSTDRNALNFKGKSEALLQTIAFDNTVFATDFTVAGVGGTRNVGSGVLNLSGVTGTINAARLYWHGLTNSAALTGGSPLLNGIPVTGVHLGFSNDNCWGSLNSQAWKADVTSSVQATGNGNYSLSGFGAMNPNGVSLVVYHDDGDNTNNRDVVVFEGNDSNINNPFDAPGWNVTLAGINYSSGTAAIQLHVGDGQPFLDDALILNAAVLAPGPQVFDGTSVPAAAGTAPFLRLWDIRSFDVTSFLSPGPNTLTLTTGVVSDCLGLIVSLIDLPAGAAPDQPIEIDIKPNSDPSSFGCKAKGNIPVALLGSAGFDVANVDANTVRFGKVGDETGEVHVKKGDAKRHIEDVNGDGFDDMVFHFNFADTGFTCVDIPTGEKSVTLEGTLTGETTDGTAFSATSDIRLTGGG